MATASASSPAVGKPGGVQKAVVATPLVRPCPAAITSVLPAPFAHQPKRPRVSGEEDPIRVASARLTEISQNILRMFPPTANLPQATTALPLAIGPGGATAHSPLQLQTAPLALPQGMVLSSSTGFPSVITPPSTATTLESPELFPLLVTPPAEVLVPELATSSSGQQNGREGVGGREGGGGTTEGGGGKKGGGRVRGKGKKRAKEEAAEEEQRSLMARLASLSQETLCELTRQVMTETRARHQQQEHAERQDPTKYV